MTGGWEYPIVSDDRPTYWEVMTRDKPLWVRLVVGGSFLFFGILGTFAIIGGFVFWGDPKFGRIPAIMSFLMGGFFLYAALGGFILKAHRKPGGEGS